MVDFFNYTGRTLCKWPKNRVLFSRKSGIASDLTANKLLEVHIEQKSRRKNICANLGPDNHACKPSPRLLVKVEYARKYTKGPPYA